VLRWRIFDTTTIAEVSCSLSLRGTSGERESTARLSEPLALSRVAELGADRGAVSALPLGSFVSWNRLSGGKLAGKVF
jgi:hypothetical protein